MRAIVIFASLMAVTVARPDVSHLAQAQGYQYQQPGSQAGSAASGGSYSSNAGYSGGNNQFAGSSNNYNVQEAAGQGMAQAGSNGYSGNAQQEFGSQGGQTYQSVSNGNGNGNSFGTSGSYSSQSSGPSSPAVVSNFGGQPSSGGSQYTTQLSGPAAGSFGQSYSGSSSQSGGANLIQGQSQSIDLTGGSSGDRVIYKPVIQQGEPIITKNFYVHAAPEEDENVRVEEKVQVVRPQKSYKIIFIKAPSVSSQYGGANYPVFPQNEEKTIVYVLSKKDDAVSEFGEIPTPPPAVTHKPEVYFIKYKTKQEAADAVANIQSQYKGEASASAGTGNTILDAGNFGVSDNGGSSNGNGNYAQSSSGSSNFGASSTGSNISPQDFRDEGSDDGNVDIASFLPNTNGNAQSIQSSAQSSFGPSGGQVAIQSSSFGPSGVQGFTQTQQFDSNGATSLGNGNEIVPQNIVRIEDEAAFAGAGQQRYLPPNCSNC